MVFVGPKSDHTVYPCQMLTVKFCLVDLTDVTLAFEDAQPKLFDVSDDDAEERIDDDFLKLKLGRDFEPKFWSRSWVTIIFF